MFDWIMLALTTDRFEFSSSEVTVLVEAVYIAHKFWAHFQDFFFGDLYFDYNLFSFFI